MDVLRLRRPLAAATRKAPAWPAGAALRPFVPEAHAPPAPALLNASYADGVGDIETFEAWWPALQADPEYDPALCFVVEDAHTLVGFAQCWTSAFIKDIAVAPTHRRRGVGGALLQAISASFAARGFTHLDLKVVAGNAPALRFYLAMGFAIASD
jgi:ribosomal protein S18 acetylase RimI-like enzyme